MNSFILSILIITFFNPVFSEENKKIYQEDFEKIKILKIEYLNKKLICVNNSKNYRQLKKCWKNKKQKN